MRKGIVLLPFGYRQVFSDFSGDSRWILASRHGAFSEGFGYQLPLVFVDHLARFVCSDFLHVVPLRSRMLTISELPEMCAAEPVLNQQMPK
jgi:hypothetical protein